MVIANKFLAQAVHGFAEQVMQLQLGTRNGTAQARAKGQVREVRDAEAVDVCRCGVQRVVVHHVGNGGHGCWTPNDAV